MDNIWVIQKEYEIKMICHEMNVIFYSFCRLVNFLLTEMLSISEHQIAKLIRSGLPKKQSILVRVQSFQTRYVLHL